jgi:pimeloyl-ACP methyl ester carboxylesterase
MSAAAVTPAPKRRSAPARRTPPADSAATRHLTLHGHDVAYRAAGDAGPAIVLVHGITSTSATWERVLALLAADHRVVAPDLFGHGESAKPRGDYSLGAFASGVRDLLGALGIDQATIVGHSLGGGVAMQLAYQFPELAERLVLVDSGGLGPEVSPLLRAATLPGSEIVLPLLTRPGLLNAGAGVGRLLGRLGLQVGTDVREMARGHATLADHGARQAFLSTLRAIIDVGGQRVDARDRLYLASKLPTLIVWGERDPIIPVAHGRGAAKLISGSRLEIFSGAGHFPHMEDPYRFAELLSGFIADTEPAAVDWEQWRELLRAGAPSR